MQVFQMRIKDQAKSLSLGALVLALSMLALSAQAQSQIEAQTEPQTQEYSIQAGVLSTALSEFAAEAGILLSADAELTAGKTSNPLQGSYTVEGALRQLLQGTGLDFRISDDNTVTLIAAPNQGAVLMLSPVKVTGELLDRSMLETNNSVDVQGYEEILRGNDTRINQAFSRSANIADLSGGLSTFDFSIRGINSGGVGGAGNQPLAAVLIDGALLTTQQLSRGYNSTFDVENIEVLRGPQSTNLGRNSLAGAVVVNTKDPEFEQNTEVLASYGEYNTYELGVVNSGPIGDSLAYRISLNRFYTDGFLENPVIGIDDYNFQETDTARIKLLYAPENLPLEVLLGYTAVRADSRNDATTYEPDAREDINRNPFLGGMETDQDVATIDISYEFSDAWQLESITTYNETVSADINSNFLASLPEPGQEWVATADQEEWNQELRLIYESESLSGVVGFYYVDQNNTALREGVAAPDFDASALGFVGFPPFDLAAVVDSPLDFQSEALYVEFDYDLTDKLTLTAGARYEEAEIVSTSYNELWYEFVGGVPVPGLDVPLIVLELTADQTTDVFLPKIGVTYALDGSQSIGFTYSEGFRSGGISLDAFTFQSTKFDPEFVDNYEFAYRSEFKNGLSVTSNLFYMDWTDMQTQDSSLINSGTFNAGEASVYGGELEINWLNDNWDTFFNVGYAKTEFGDFTIGDVSVKGNQFPTAPKLTLATGAYYSLENWTLGGEVSYRGKSYVDAVNTFEIDPLTLVNMTAAYDYQNFRFELFVNNLFDQRKTLSSDYVVEGQAVNSLNAPRVAGLRIEYGFN